ncbi:hypothetical protein SNEBB_008960 [Seison nebaliae]|nr:hypothetical protein SNEBB_008960 [Seison nebaliae]
MRHKCQSGKYVNITAQLPYRCSLRTLVRNRPRFQTAYGFWEESLTDGFYSYLYCLDAESLLKNCPDLDQLQLLARASLQNYLENGRSHLWNEKNNDRCDLETMVKKKNEKRFSSSKYSPSAILHPSLIYLLLMNIDRRHFAQIFSNYLYEFDMLCSLDGSLLSIHRIINSLPSSSKETEIIFKNLLNQTWQLEKELKVNEITTIINRRTPSIIHQPKDYIDLSSDQFRLQFLLHQMRFAHRHDQIDKSIEMFRDDWEINIRHLFNLSIPFLADEKELDRLVESISNKDLARIRGELLSKEKKMRFLPITNLGEILEFKSNSLSFLHIIGMMKYSDNSFLNNFYRSFLLNRLFHQFLHQQIDELKKKELSSHFQQFIQSNVNMMLPKIFDRNLRSFSSISINDDNENMTLIEGEQKIMKFPMIGSNDNYPNLLRIYYRFFNNYHRTYEKSGEVIINFFRTYPDDKLIKHLQLMDLAKEEHCGRIVENFQRISSPTSRHISQLIVMRKLPNYYLNYFTRRIQLINESIIDEIRNEPITHNIEQLENEKDLFIFNYRKLENENSEIYYKTINSSQYIVNSLCQSFSYFRQISTSVTNERMMNDPIPYLLFRSIFIVEKWKILNELLNRLKELHFDIKEVEQLEKQNNIFPLEEKWKKTCFHDGQLPLLFELRKSLDYGIFRRHSKYFDFATKLFFQEYSKSFTLRHMPIARNLMNRFNTKEYYSSISIIDNIKKNFGLFERFCQSLFVTSNNCGMNRNHISLITLYSFTSILSLVCNILFNNQFVLTIHIVRSIQWKLLLELVFSNAIDFDDYVMYLFLKRLRLLRERSCK